ncbi:hypothetical protein [Halogranum amylolyticum]|uniref:hypothetical protein n=1 Tax=Halogranum amylolyticum TaxID=660520 RepID=UPI000AF64B50|nr:hypothetical protein [Halogranum amylolyticum]
MSRLREAVRQADERGQTTLAERGRETVTTLEAYRRAAAGERPDDGHHFHSGRGTPLPGAGQGGDR